MNKKIALLIYPNFSMQEIANLCWLFRWNYDTSFVTFSDNKELIYSEEGLLFQPEKILDEFCKKDYDALILPGSSDEGENLKNQNITDFLSQFRDDNEFLIGAICAGPMYLAKAGLLKDKKYTDSLFVEMRELYSFIQEENFVRKPVVVDENIVTAVGSAFNDFAVTIAKQLGYECSDKILSGYIDDWNDEDYDHHLSKEDIEWIKREHAEFVE